MAEIRYAVTHEGALHLEDVLTRRTRISIEYPHRGVACAAVVADVIGAILGWDAATRAREVENYVARVDAERASQAKTDDADADAVRSGGARGRTRPSGNPGTTARVMRRVGTAPVVLSVLSSRQVSISATTDVQVVLVDLASPRSAPSASRSQNATSSRTSSAAFADGAVRS